MSWDDPGSTIEGIVMAIRDKLAAGAARFLEPGEQIQSVFCAQTKSQYLGLISFWILIFSNSYRVVVVTDRRILVCQAGALRSATIKRVLYTLPRLTPIGPASGVWYRTDTLGDRLHIHFRFHKDIALADSIGAGYAHGTA